MSVRHTFRDLYRYAGWATVLGLVADFAGLFVYDLLFRGQYTITTASNPFLLGIIAVAERLTFAANFMLARKLLRLPTKQSLLLAAVMTIVTSPWLGFGTEATWSEGPYPHTDNPPLLPNGWVLRAFHAIISWEVETGTES